MRRINLALFLALVVAAAGFAIYHYTTQPAAKTAACAKPVIATNHDMQAASSVVDDWLENQVAAGRFHVAKKTAGDYTWTVAAASVKPGRIVLTITVGPQVDFLGLPIPEGPLQNWKLTLVRGCANQHAWTVASAGKT